MTSRILPRPAKPLIRVSFFFTKHPSMTDAEFKSHWRDTHGALAVASRAFRDANVQQYTQIHNDRTLRNEAAKMGLPVLDLEWDACSEMYFHTWEDYQGFANSDEMRDVLGPDGARIMHPEKGVKVVVALVDPLFKSVL